MDTNNPHAAARAAMAQDQADVATRDQTSWDLNVRMSEANASQTEAMAHAIRARGELQQALANAVHTGIALAVVTLAARAVRGACHFPSLRRNLP